MQVGNEPSAISILAEAVRGQKGYDQGASCTACGEPQADKRCSACKSVQYCGPACQKLHWFTHKRHCARLAAEHQEKVLAEKAAQEESEKRAAAEKEQATTTGEEKQTTEDSAAKEPAADGASNAPATATPIKTT